MASEDQHPYHKLVLPKGASFELRPSPGKGWGAFATQDIKPATIVLEELPLFSITKSPQEITEQGFERIVARLSYAQRTQLTLLRVGDDINNKTLASITDTLCVNAFDRDDGMGTGLYPIAARFNHSCVPNMINTRGGPGVTLKAFVPIASGTELTFKYEGYLECLTCTERQTELSQLRGQPCRCDICTAGPDKRYLSDMRRRFVRALYFLIFGHDLAATYHRKMEVEIEDLIPDVKLRDAAQRFRVPLTSRLAYCSLVFALLEAEDLLNPVNLQRVLWIIRDATSHLRNQATQTLVCEVLIGISHGSLAWRRIFGGLATVFGRADPGDEVGNAALQARLAPLREKEIINSAVSGDDLLRLVEFLEGMGGLE